MEENLTELIKKQLTLVPHSSFGNFQVKPIECFKRIQGNKALIPLNYSKNKEVLLEERPLENELNDYIKIRKGPQQECLDLCMKEKGKNYGGGIINIQTGGGKCLAKGTNVILYDGTVKKVEEIQIGELLLGDDGTSRTVVRLGQGKGQLYKISNLFFDEFVCNKDHILVCCNDIKINKLSEYYYEVVYFCPERACTTWKEYTNLRDALLSKIHLEKVLGTIEISVDDYIRFNCELKCKFLIFDQVPNPIVSDCPYFLGVDLVNGEDLEVLKYSKIQRLEILAGVIDSLNHNKKYYNYYHPLKNIKATIKLLFRSLGFICDNSSYILYKISDCVVPVRTSPKVEILKIENKFSLEVSEYYKKDQYYGFEISGNGRFVLGDFLITHNTVLGIKMISEFKQKSLIIVNKIELLNQWTSEINKFIPDAKVGIIQGSKFDTEGFDIVIGMLQTVSKRDSLTSKNFDYFGLCIIDECHNIASEIFSKIMWKIRPKYLFGLSATLERKDKMEQLIKWYIGDLIYTDSCSNLKQQTDIIIHHFTGESSKELVLKDGTPAVSTMITNISKDKARNKLILKILKEVSSDTDRQILVISDRTDQLKLLDKYLENSGLFIGKMKKEDLEKSKENQILLATYGMVAEGFNLPKLNTLLLATPRSNLTQTIGRIYRKKHSITPMIIDIVDSFSIFKSQQYARQRIYKKNIEKHKSTTEPLEKEEEFCLLSEN